MLRAYNIHLIALVYIITGLDFVRSRWINAADRQGSADNGHSSSSAQLRHMPRANISPTAQKKYMPNCRLYKYVRIHPFYRYFEVQYQLTLEGRKLNSSILLR